ncbi:J domain-containing protein [Magnetospirillum moscoviense]|uniref:Molecular chaperone DnaJ n=1 Tax=Magnetospirillum moscoviense TaxID=1437059 RepID=A0A178N1X7_9PROT|nr:J domain-containing protein [Magnetospirillum moscoviense]MBF0326643.1 J domain-containing protein [Alphaproteobacteria bacterium]OAN65484.1 molecular chaperone DnaJ [Magnetospirillum moscoviense]
MRSTSTKRSWRQIHDRPEERPQTKACDHPGCAHVGEYRAPKGRDQLDQYYWFCLDHVRAYNASWDFYKGMSPDEIEDEIRRSTTWQRPTWPLGTKTGNRRFNFGIHDPLGVFDDVAEDLEKARTRPPTPEELALAELELTGPVTIAEIKAAYKVLVKRHHPDANNGDKESEERFKRISQAYKLLMTALSA